MEVKSERGSRPATILAGVSQTRGKGIEMTNKKIIALVATAALASCLALAGCGGSQAASSSAASSASGSAASSSAVESSSAAASASTASSASAPAASSAAASSASYIGDAAAKEIALKDAGVAEADCTELKVKLDTDDAVVHYDVEFKAGGMEYDYDIDPTTGAILKAESEIDD